MANILIGVTGSIAAYKAAEIVSDLIKKGHTVQCVLTASAAEFVSPLVLETLSHNPVQTALFGPGVSGTEHIRLARWADLVVIAPATANVLSKLALGLADDLLTTVFLATEAPVLIAPAMNTVMWEKPVIRAHVETLRARDVAFVAPGSGLLACGEVGEGKLATPAEIVAAIEAQLTEANVAQDLAGKRVLITAGPTTTAIDAVRYITNHATGRMGAAMAEEALRRGAEVRYVLGVDKGVVRPIAPPGRAARLTITEVRTAEEMCAAALAQLPDVDGVIATAAVMDYRVETPAIGKLKRATADVTLAMVPSVDVLASLRAAAATKQWFMGFAAETDDIAANAAGKLQTKRLDYLFANRVAKGGEKLATGFAGDTNAGTLFRKDGAAVEMPLQSKAALARALWNHLV